MNDSYFFDKRKMKRGFGKYAIIFLIAFVPMILFNIYVGKYLQNWLVILLDCVLLLVFVCIGNIIAKRIFERKDAKLEAKIKEREELNKRKKIILEESYKAKREKKQQEKEKAKETEAEIVVEDIKTEQSKKTTQEVKEKKVSKANTKTRRK